MTVTHPPIHVVGIGGTLREPSTSLNALERALHAAQHAGATVELLDLNKLRLPMYEPDKHLHEYGKNVLHFVAVSQRADAMLWSTAAYHGTLAGVTKNALDFLETLSGGERPYLDHVVVGLIATAGGDQAAVNTIGTMVHIVHSLRGIAAPLSVPIHHARKAFDADRQLFDRHAQERLDKLGALVVELAKHMRHPQQELAGV